MPARFSRLLWMIAQTFAIGGMTWLSFNGDAKAKEIPAGPREVLFALCMWTLLVAFATGLLTRLWDLSLAALARRRTAGRQR